MGTLNVNFTQDKFGLAYKSVKTHWEIDISSISLRIVLVLRNRCVGKLFNVCWMKLKLKFITQATFVDFSLLQSNGRVPVYLCVKVMWSDL